MSSFRRRSGVRPLIHSRLARQLNGLLILVLACSSWTPTFAQEEDLAPPPKKEGVQITFLPPPIEGTLSLGIYDQAGKLVRTLHREATEKDFAVGLNGLITRWDGRDDSGAPLPQGKYSARGYAVGEVEIEGVAMHGNDWISDEDAPRLRRVISGAFLRPAGADEPAAGKYRFIGETVSGEFSELEFGAEGKLQRHTSIEPGAARETSETVAIRNGRVFTRDAGGETEVPGIIDAIYAFRNANLPEEARPAARAGSLWVIEKTDEGTEVKQFLTTGEFRRRLKIQPADPQPIAVSAALHTDEIMLIEESPREQRVRILSLEAVEPNAPEDPNAPPVQSTWKTVFSKSIRTSLDFASVADQLGRAQGVKPEEKITVRLLPNPLFKEASTSVDLKVEIDPEGALLRTSDGLALHRLTEAPHLKWSVIAREGSGKLLTLFQSDGAVVEEFRVRKLAGMMAFDAGEYEWTGR